MIRRLDPVTVNKIAAGEVVERPVSVAKELIENALDAGATALRISINDGPAYFLEVSDNGSGIPYDELPLAFERHATSKINEIDDLWALHSFGFRGEALPSIAAVSRCTCISQTEDGHGGKIVIEGGKTVVYEAASRERGTTLRVENLFYTIPARKKYLKSNEYEMRLIREYCAKLAFAHADKRLRLILMKNGGTVLSFTEHDDFSDRIRHYYGSEIADGLIPFAGDGRFFSFTGYIGARHISKTNSFEMNFWVNERPIRDKKLLFTVKNALHGIFEPQEYPYVFLFLTVDGEQVDVNVHPQKAEVRFADDKELYSAVYHAVRPLFTTMENVSATSFTDSLQTFITEPHAEYAVRPGSLFEAGDAQSEHTEREIPHDYNYNGLVFDRYLVFASNEEMLFIDFHALNERILYDRFSANDMGDHVARIIPQAVHVGRQYADVIAENAELFERFGITVRPFGDDTVIVETVPLIGSRHADAESIIRRIIDGLETDDPRHPRAETIAQMACKASLRTGDQVSSADAELFLNYCLKGGFTLTCPHGRPVVKRIAHADIDQWFKRL